MTEHETDNGAGSDYGTRHPCLGVGLPAQLADLPNHVHRMYWELFDMAYAELKDPRGAHLRALQYFLREIDHAMFVVYPRSHPSKPVEYWLMRCLYCGRESRTGAEFAHKPDCFAERLKRGEADVEELVDGFDLA